MRKKKVAGHDRQSIGLPTFHTRCASFLRLSCVGVVFRDTESTVLVLFPEIALLLIWSVPAAGDIDISRREITASRVCGWCYYRVSFCLMKGTMRVC